MHPFLIFTIGFAIGFLPMVLLIAARDPKPAGTLHLRLSFSNIQTDVTMVQIRNNQKVSGQLKAKDSKGDDAQIQAGSVQVSVDNSEVASVEQDPDDETKITVVGGRAGATVLRIKADADLGEGVTEITAEVAVEITAGQATGFGVEFGEPQDQ